MENLKFFILIALSAIFINSQIPRVPEWAKKAVWYQIFPERFANGDTTNDPKGIDLAGGWPYVIPEDWHISPWTSDWYKTQPWEATNKFDFYGDAGMRRYGGDLQGVLNRLDYLQELGINAIYFNPLFESPSLHKYDASMYHHIDNNFGPYPEGDRKMWAAGNPADPASWKWTSADKLFLKLISECHKRGMKVIIDGVFNHVGNTFWAFQDVVKNQEKSPYKDWFYINSFDNPATDSNEFNYSGWYGVKDLPELREDENGLVAGPREHIHDIVKRWMDPNDDGNPADGIDGWRLDVADMVSINFWRDFRKWVKGINPQAYITGEVWWQDWNHDKMFNAAPWLQGDAFDAVMNYRFTRAVKDFVIDKKKHVSAEAFRDSIKQQERDYSKDNLYVLMNLLGSHDTERLASLIVNPDHWYDHHQNPNKRKDFDVRKPNAEEIQKQKLCAGIQMTMPGAPMIYYGDEAGMWGGDDPDCRKPMVWQDMTYETETTHPFGLKREPDPVKFDQDLFDWYKKLISIRKSDDLFSLGDLKFFNSGNFNILIFSRKLGDEEAIVIVNSSDQSIQLDFSNPELPGKEEMTDLITEVKCPLKDKNIKTELKPYQIVILN